MGLESHITRSLQREKSGFVEGEDYWFSNGLTTEDAKTAFDISKILDETGEFGPTRVKRVVHSDGSANFKVEFGIHKQFMHPGKNYDDYVIQFLEDSYDR